LQNGDRLLKQSARRRPVAFQGINGASEQLGQNIRIWRRLTVSGLRKHVGCHFHRLIAELVFFDLRSIGLAHDAPAERTAGEKPAKSDRLEDKGLMFHRNPQSSIWESRLAPRA
jgi:hypothetical protein